MSFKPNNQSINKPINKILNGFKEFEISIDNRIKSNDFKRTHLHELDNMRIEFNKLKLKLQLLEKDNW